MKTRTYLTTLATLAFLSLLAILLAGCSHLNSTVTETKSGTNTVIETRITAHTFLNGNSELAKFTARQGAYTNNQYIGIGSLSQTQPATNLAPVLELLGKIVLEGLAAQVKP